MPWQTRLLKKLSHNPFWSAFFDLELGSPSKTFTESFTIATKSETRERKKLRTVIFHLHFVHTNTLNFGVEAAKGGSQKEKTHVSQNFMYNVGRDCLMQSPDCSIIEDFKEWIWILIDLSTLLSKTGSLEKVFRAFMSENQQRNRSAQNQQRNHSAPREIN